MNNILSEVDNAIHEQVHIENTLLSIQEALGCNCLRELKDLCQAIIAKVDKWNELDMFLASQDFEDIEEL